VLRPVVLSLVASLLGCASPTPAPIEEAPAEQAVIDDYFGTKVEDPYRWMEELDAPETRAWIKEQNAKTRAIVDNIPAREGIHKRLTQLWDFERISQPTVKGTRTFTWKNSGLANQPILWVQDGENEPTKLLDPNTLSEDGTMSVAFSALTEDGSKLAWAVADAGSDWRILRVRDVASGKDMADEVRWVKFSDASWLKDGSGFFYSRYPKPEKGLQDAVYFHKIYFHKLGTSQDQDVLVYEDAENKEYGFHGQVTPDGQWLVVEITRGTEERNLVHVLPLDPAALNGGKAPEGALKVVPEWKDSWLYAGNEGDIFYFLTDEDAPMGRLVARNVRTGETTEIVPQSDATLRSVTRRGNRFVGSYLEDAYSSLKVFSMTGELQRTLELPGIGSVGGLEPSLKDEPALFTYSSFIQPETVYTANLGTGAIAEHTAPALTFDPSTFVTEQVFYQSKDGTHVPMFITRKKDLAPNGQLPTLLYGYGGFNIPITPRFKPDIVAWLEMGGVFASANLRGGGEYGREWHEAGTKLHKQNVFDDFIAAAEYLHEQNWTRPDKLAVEGRSNGGLLIGATMTQRPDLMGVALPTVGVLDMLRYHKFTIGWAWASDYGTSEESKEMFEALYAYSPVHNTRAGTHYPSTMVLTGDHDDRVVPSHSYKFASALQRDQAGDKPIVIRIETRAGHGAGTPVSMKIDEIADKYAFVTRELGMTLP